MARVRICPVCEFHNKPGEIFCEQDGVSLIDVPITNSDNGPQRPSAVDPAARPQTPGTRREEAQPATRVALEFPWGTVDVMGRLPVGRDPGFSPLADQLNDYVSQRHAEVFLEGSQLYVRHVGTTNPTYVNGTPIERDKPVQLADGDRLNFSWHMTAIVRLG
jgi:hypothetical protein